MQDNHLLTLKDAPYNWGDVKRVYRQIYGPRLVELGFPNPGSRMWRHREFFVDCVELRLSNRRMGYSIELGCHPKYVVQANPRATECLFQRRCRYEGMYFAVYGLFLFARTLEEQEDDLLILLPNVIEDIRQWFGRLTTRESAIGALIKDSQEESLYSHSPGSPAYNEAMRVLQEMP